MKKTESLRELRRSLLKALANRHRSDWEYKAYCQAWQEYATARSVARRPISDKEYNTLHKL